jgi:hypothetical protein
MERRVAATLAADEAQVEIDMWFVDAWLIQDQASRVLWEQLNHYRLTPVGLPPCCSIY